MAGLRRSALPEAGSIGHPRVAWPRIGLAAAGVVAAVGLAVEAGVWPSAALDAAGVRREHGFVCAVFGFVIIGVGLVLRLRNEAVPEVLEIEPAEAGFFKRLVEREREALARLEEPCPEYGLASNGPAPSDAELDAALRRSRARVTPALGRGAGLATAIAFAAALHTGALMLSARALPVAGADPLAGARATIERIDAVAEQEAVDAEVPLTENQADNKEGGTGMPFHPSAEALRCVASFDLHGRWCGVSPFERAFHLRFLRFHNHLHEILLEDTFAIFFAFDAPVDCARGPAADLGPRSYCAYRSARQRLEGIGEAKTSRLAEDLLPFDASVATAPRIIVRPRWERGTPIARRLSLAGEALRLCTAAEPLEIGATTEMWFLIGEDEHPHLQTSWHGSIPRPVAACMREVLGTVSFADLGQIHSLGMLDLRITSR